ncbi:hypothetical protein D910_11137 [Dendroctonus ponderosae]|uniref:Uncharacterized protein n=1 Tax=Dendroctonus ponderosae TaxID=77166 RepID=U4UUJ9_DENPD|nr:hypothetical protein D910_11137 [Dendroctonus ponderosae]
MRFENWARLEESKTRSEEEKTALQQKIEEIRIERDNAQNEAENLKVQLHLCEDKSESVSNLLHETTRKLKEGKLRLFTERGEEDGVIKVEQYFSGKQLRMFEEGTYGRVEGSCEENGERKEGTSAAAGGCPPKDIQ